MLIGRERHLMGAGDAAVFGCKFAGHWAGRRSSPSW